MSHRSRVTLAVLAGWVAVAACGGDDPTPPQDLAPNLAGTYDLTSFSSLVTDGETLVPPDVEGTFVIQQAPPTGPESSGTFEWSVRVPDGLGGQGEIVDSGTFTVRSDGTLEQAGDLYQTKGTFTFLGGTLTVIVDEPLVAVSTSVWQRR